MDIINKEGKMQVESILNYLGTPEGQHLLILCGSGLAAAAIGIWAVIKFFFSKSVSAKNNSIAAGRNVNIKYQNDKNNKGE
jgi:hypothetical protein